MFRNLFFIVVSLCILTGCHDEDLLKVGSYEGQWIQSSGPRLEKRHVKAQVFLKENSARQVEIRGEKGLSSDLELSLSGDRETLELNFTQLNLQNVQLSASGDCFIDSDQRLVQVCHQNSGLQLQILNADLSPSFSLSLSPQGAVPAKTLEVPASFTLDEAVKVAMDREFSTRIEYQQMLQAKYTATQSLMALLPSLNGGTILAFSSGPQTVIDILTMADNLAPFLFPSHWILASENAALSEAEKKAYAIAKGSAGLQIENFAYTIHHDQEGFDSLMKVLTMVGAFQKDVSDQEVAGKVPQGTALHVSSIWNSLHDLTDDYRERLDLQKQALAQAMGFINPQAVQGISVPDFDYSVINNPDLKFEDLKNSVIANSLELQQMNRLIDAAKLGVSADAFSWLDPAADVNHSLGFGLGATLMIDQTQVDSLIAQRDQVEAILLQGLAAAVTEYNHSLDDLNDSLDGVKLEEKRMELLKSELAAGKPVSPDELTSIPSDLLSWHIHLQDAELEFRSSLAKLNRLLMKGYYSGLPEVGVKNP